MKRRDLTVVDGEYDAAPEYTRRQGGEPTPFIVDTGEKDTNAARFGRAVALNALSYCAHAVAAGSMYPFEWSDGVRYSAALVMFIGSIAVAFLMNREL